MKYRRALFLAEPGKDAGPVIALLRRVAPELEHLRVVLPVAASSWFGGERARMTHRAELKALRALSQGAAPVVEVQSAPELSNQALVALCVDEEIDLLVFGARSLRNAPVLTLQRKLPPLAMLWAQSEEAVGPIEQIGCVALDERSRAAIEVFLRDHADPTLHVTLVSPTAVAPDVLSKSLQVSGIQAAVEVSSSSDAESMWQWLDAWMRTRRVDLLVFARVPTAMFLGALSSTPVLVVPPPPAARPFGVRALDVCDLVTDGRALRARVDQFTGVADLAPVADQDLAIVSSGRVVATVRSWRGEVELPAGLEAASLGIYRVGTGATADPLAAIEQRVALLRPAQRPLVLFDAELSTQSLRALAASSDAAQVDLLAVRLRPTRSARAFRRRLRALGLPPPVVDARAILDEGDAIDVSEVLDPVRLARVATRLADAGFPVAAIVHAGNVRPEVKGLVALYAAELEDNPTLLSQAVAHATSPVSAMRSVAAVSGNRIQLELDNRAARAFLLDAIAGSTQSLHLQVYMAMDDDVGGPIAAALAAAGARGVSVRMLVDSLHGMHGSFGVQNPLLERLSMQPGVELRTMRPLTELPSLAELKQRDHRKLVIADGRLALLGGRNLSHEYYTGFDEVQLTAESTWREVPWLDGGARVEGPVVAQLSASFLEAWTEAGGAPFAITTPPAVGSTLARVIVHHGLRDAHTLETYLELIDGARSHIYVVNGFPLLLETQHALLRALRRGLRVRFLVGHITPTHDGTAFGGPWATARTIATEFLHSRVDPLIAAGAETYLFAVHDPRGWAPGLGVVQPHVHAKALSADGQRCAVGSANLDMTASYWESELLLVVEDAALTAAFEGQIDQLMAASVRVLPDDPAWQQLAKRRAWLRHWPGVLAP